MVEQTETTTVDPRAVLSRRGDKGVQWYAVLDAAQSDEVLERSKESGETSESLYAGELGGQLAEVAPLLTTLDLSGDFARWLCASWGRSLGIYFQSTSAFSDMRKHWRRFLVVKDDKARKLRFRFYDPRVLRSFLPACTRSELEEFFGPINCFFAEGANGRTVVELRRRRDALSTDEFEVDRPKDRFSKTAPRRVPQGGVMVTVVDADRGMPIVGASVQVSGPEARQALSGPGGFALFEGIQPGAYQVLAMDDKLRMGKANANVGSGRTELLLECRHV